MVKKFRAYDLVENEWINIRTVGLSDNGELWYLQAYDDNENDIDPPYFEKDLGKTWVLLQSTGLLDKNGKEIYEGDILQHKVQGTGVVFYPFRDTMASFGIKNVNTNFRRNLQDTDRAGYEIIGNIFENKHLLEEE